MNTVFSLKDLTDQQKSFLPSKKQVDFYKKNGWYISEKIIPESILDNANIAVQEFYEGKIDSYLKGTIGIANDEYNIDSAIRNNEFVTLQKKEIQALGFYPLIGAIASVLAETSEVRLFADSLINKLPEKPLNKGIVGWHSDKAYWPTCTSNNMITAWIPLDDCSLDMGPLTHLNGSHLWRNEKELLRFFSFNNQDLSMFESYLKTKKQNCTKTSMILKRGQVSFHNCHTIHASYPNVSNKKRLALAIHLQDKNNKYRETYQENGELVVLGYDKICSKDSNGNPDYRDSELFPLIFKK